MWESLVIPCLEMFRDVFKVVNNLFKTLEMLSLRILTIIAHWGPFLRRSYFFMSILILMYLS